MLVFDSKQLPNVNNEMINDLISEHKDKKLPKYQKMEGYYTLSKQKILERTMTDATKPNNQLINDFPGYIVDVIKGYFIGIPITYTPHDVASIVDKNFVEKLKEVGRANSEILKNIELAKYMGIAGEAFEIVYVDEKAQVRYTRVPNNEMLVVYDSSIEPEIVCAIRYYDIYNVTLKQTTSKCEVYWSDKIDYFERGASLASGDGFTQWDWHLVDSKPHHFKKVPVVHYKNNEELMGDFERVMALIDDYDFRISDNSNELEYFGDAYLKIKNMSGTTQEDLNTARENRAFFVDGDGDVGFITKEAGAQSSDTHINKIEDNIHKFAKVPNMSDEKFAGNLSGVAIKFKLWPLEQVAIDKEQMVRSGIYRRIELISTILSIQGSDTYDKSMVDMSFTRNIPSNVVELAEMVSKLKGIASDETLLEQLPFVDDATSEIEKRNAQVSGLNLDNEFPDNNNDSNVPPTGDQNNNPIGFGR